MITKTAKSVAHPTRDSIVKQINARFDKHLVRKITPYTVQGLYEFSVCLPNEYRIRFCCSGVRPDHYSASVIHGTVYVETWHGHVGGGADDKDRGTLTPEMVLPLIERWVKVADKHVDQPWETTPELAGVRRALVAVSKAMPTADVQFTYSPAWHAEVRIHVRKLDARGAVVGIVVLSISSGRADRIGRQTVQADGESYFEMRDQVAVMSALLAAIDKAQLFGRMVALPLLAEGDSNGARKLTLVNGKEVNDRN